MHVSLRESSTWGRKHTRVDYRIETLGEGSVRVTLSGTMNEDAEMSLKTVAGELQGASVAQIHLGGLRSMNSLGVRSWVNFLRAIPGETALVFTEVAPIMIQQINMIPSCQGRAHIASFYTNYLCETCNKTKVVLTETQLLPPKSPPPGQRCERPDCDMATEELEEEYFAFLQR